MSVSREQFAAVLPPRAMAALPPQVVAPPEGKARFFHYSRPENVDSIREHGLLKSKAVGETYGEPNQVWGASVPDEQVPKFLHDNARRGAIVAEFHAEPEKELTFDTGGGRDPNRNYDYWRKSSNHVTMLGDVPPSSIRHVHEPWEAHVRDMADYESLASYDHLLEEGGMELPAQQGLAYHRIREQMQEDLDR